MHQLNQNWKVKRQKMVVFKIKLVFVKFNKLIDKLFDFYSPNVKNLRIFLAFTLCVTVCNAYKVLFLGPFNGKSHFLYIQSFVRALIERGHEVTFLTSNSLSHLNLANYTEVLVDPPIDLTSQSGWRCFFSFYFCVVF